MTKPPCAHSCCSSYSWQLHQDASSAAACAKGPCLHDTACLAASYAALEACCCRLGQ